MRKYFADEQELALQFFRSCHLRICRLDCDVFHSAGRFPRGLRGGGPVCGSLVAYALVGRGSMIVVVVAFSGRLQIMGAWSRRYSLYFGKSFKKDNLNTSWFDLSKHEIS
jgi:hypothetical protein